MDDKEIERLERALTDQPTHELLGEVPGNTTVAEFCLSSVKKMMLNKGSPHTSFHVFYGGSVYYIDMAVRAIAPPFDARDPNLDERQWFGQRET